MFNLKGRKSGNSAASAKVVDGRLMLSFPVAVKPVLWQMDLAETRSSAFEIDQNKEGRFSLRLKKEGQSEEIAGFETREAATDALSAVGAALERTPARPAAALTGAVFSGGQAGAAGNGNGGGMKAFAVLTGIALIVVLLVLMNNMTPRPPKSIAAKAEPQSAVAGQPVSADEYLRTLE